MISFWFRFCTPKHNSNRKNQELAELEQTDETDAETQSEHSSKVGEDLERFVARMLRHARLVERGEVEA